MKVAVEIDYDDYWIRFLDPDTGYIIHKEYWPTDWDGDSHEFAMEIAFQHGWEIQSIVPL